MKRFQPGDRVAWTYKHHLNRRQHTIREKVGTYHGLIKHTERYRGEKQLALVSFDGNIRASKVPADELRIANERGR